MEKESELPPIHLGRPIGVVMKISQPSEGPSTQRTNSTSNKVPGKDKVGEEVPIIGVNQTLGDQEDLPKVKGHDVK